MVAARAEAAKYCLGYSLAGGPIMPYTCSLEESVVKLNLSSGDSLTFCTLQELLRPSALIMRSSAQSFVQYRNTPQGVKKR